MPENIHALNMKAFTGSAQTLEGEHFDRYPTLNYRVITNSMYLFNQRQSSPAEKSSGRGR